MHRFICMLVLAGLFITACNFQQDNVKPAPVISQRSEILIHRYEKALFELPTRDLKTGMASLYPEYKFFLGNEWQDTMNILRIYNFITDTNVRELYKLVMRNYPDQAVLKTSLDKSFNKIRSWYPGIRYPEVFTYVSGLDLELPVIYSDTAMAISLDLFLGKDEPAYEKAGIPVYLRARLNKDNLLPVCMHAISDSLIPTDENKQSLIDQMIRAGKALYFIDQVLPETADEYKIGYEAGKLEWCTANEANIWSFIVGNQALFSSDPKVTSKFMSDAPFTSGFDQTSPGRLGEWVGWQIVKAYMQNNSSMKLPDLMKNMDSQAILEGSKYKPHK